MCDCLTTVDYVSMVSSAYIVHYATTILSGPTVVSPWLILTSGLTAFVVDSPSMVDFASMIDSAPTVESFSSSRFLSWLIVPPSWIHG